MSQKSHKHFREKLLAQEKSNPEYQERYKEEIRMMIEKKLTRTSRWVFIILTVYGVVAAVLPVIILVVDPTIPMTNRVGMVLASLIGLFIAGFFGWILKKGSINIQSNLTVLSVFLGCTWFATIFFIMFSVVQELISESSLFVMIVGTLSLIITATIILMIRIYQSETKTQERLLKIEYSLAELVENMRQDAENKERP